MRLTTRLSRLADLFSWGDLSEADYGRQMAEVRAQLAAPPSTDHTDGTGRAVLPLGRAG